MLTRFSGVRPEPHRPLYDAQKLRGHTVDGQNPA